MTANKWKQIIVQALNLAQREGTFVEGFLRAQMAANCSCFNAQRNIYVLYSDCYFSVFIYLFIYLTVFTISCDIVKVFEYNRAF